MNYTNTATLLTQVGQYPVLTFDEEQELFRKYKHGEPLEAEIAKRNLVRHNLRLVVKVVNQGKRFSDPDDLFQEGCLGLLRAIEKFDPNRGLKFSTYATGWIRSFIQRWQKRDRMIKVPEHLANELYIPVDSLNVYTNLSKGSKSPIEKLDLVKARPEKQPTLGELAAEWVEAMLLEHHVWFKPKDVLIFISHYGLFGRDVMTYRASGALVGVSHQSAVNATNRVFHTLKCLKNENTHYNRRYVWNDADFDNLQNPRFQAS